MGEPSLSRFPLPSPRRSLALVAATAMIAMTAAFGIGAAGPSGAQAPDHTFEITSPVPARGYWLPTDMVEFEADCDDPSLDYRYDASDSLGNSGWWGGWSWGKRIAPWAHEGVHIVGGGCGVLAPDGGTTPVAWSTVEVEVGPIMDLVATVGTEPGECATTTEITVEAGTEVFWCYTLVLNPELPDDWFRWYDIEHEISDVLNGVLGIHTEAEPVTLVGSLSTNDLGFVSSSVIEETTENTGNWLIDAVDVDSDYGDTRYPLTPKEATARALVEGDEGGETTTTTEAGPTTTQPSGAQGTTDAPAAAAATPQRANPAYTG